MAGLVCSTDLTGSSFRDFGAVFLVDAALRFAAGFCADAFFAAPFADDVFLAAVFFVVFAAIRSLTLYFFVTVQLRFMLLYFCKYHIYSTKCPMIETNPTAKQ